jgi:hypothetical protein
MVIGNLILGGYDRSRHSNKTLQAPSTIDIIVGVQSKSRRLATARRRRC